MVKPDSTTTKVAGNWQNDYEVLISSLSIPLGTFYIGFSHLGNKPLRGKTTKVSSHS